MTIWPTIVVSKYQVWCRFSTEVRQNRISSRGFYIKWIPSGGAWPDLLQSRSSNGTTPSIILFFWHSVFSFTSTYSAWNTQYIEEVVNESTFRWNCIGKSTLCEYSSGRCLRVFTIYKRKLDVSFVQTFVKTTTYVWTCLTKQIASYRVYDHVERILHFHLALVDCRFRISYYGCFCSCCTNTLEVCRELFILCYCHVVECYCTIRTVCKIQR